jgi:hypothetical protein
VLLETVKLNTDSRQGLVTVIEQGSLTKAAAVWHLS